MRPYLNYDQVKNMLPQKYPFIFIDQVIEVEPDKRIVCIKNLTGNESFFQGHFPENAVFPGVLIIEAMAQSAILLSKISLGEENDEEQAFLLAGTKSRFIHPAFPGDQIRFKTELIKSTKLGGIVSSSAWVEDVEIAKADLTFAISSKEKILV
ncbi:3-hydroxyacyl-ACP dehydratase FabZ [Metabacillus arenae]|uniref:3-hydroxyacyl-[acyl-carrier-protein] dehydratase n=1 Tax=Metabacillus arenae TaxID=2771434 RepID=A0A926NDZ8_9BACI|nr:3-hydroxyacyl-ACP dehydratase FabZ [Metabacillus arenae]MBD1379496.1 3-hydroxyacyl-ACP dehydratase FabZ [Metabacillus arenae]